MTCPCNNCILLPVCKNKINKHVMYLTEKYYYNGFSDENKYYYKIRDIYRNIMNKCNILNSYYLFNDDISFTIKYYELRKIFDVKYNLPM